MTTWVVDGQEQNAPVTAMKINFWAMPRFAEVSMSLSSQPTSAMICCAESTPRPGTSANRSTCILMQAEQTCNLLIRLTDHQLQVCKCHFHEPAVDRVEFDAGTQRVAQLCERGTQTLIGQGG